MQDTLKQSGFTDIRIVPDSFFVQAKDKGGNPIAMLIGPNSVTELVDAVHGPAAAGTGNNPFVANAGADMMSSKLVGATVHNQTNQSIGTVHDVAMTNGRVQAYVLDVGGFLGMGDHYVAVAPTALNLGYAQGGKAVTVTMNTTQAELRAAPEFKYNNG